MTQNYNNHSQIVPGFHQFLFPLMLLTLIGAAVNLYLSWGNHDRLYSASLILVLSFCLLLAAFFSRMFANRAQDRAIRAEENLRHYVLTGKLLDPRLTVPQIIGLRFASDGEFVALSKKAADEGLSNDAIKRAIGVWRPDLYRV